MLAGDGVDLPGGFQFGLHGVEHAIYDVWLTECKGGTELVVDPKEPEPAPAVEAAPQPDYITRADLEAVVSDIAASLKPLLGLAEQFVPRIVGVRYVLIPASAETRGHGTHTWARFWEDELVALLERTER